MAGSAPRPTVTTTGTTNTNVVAQTPIIYEATANGANRSTGVPDFEANDRLQLLNGVWRNISPGKGWELESVPANTQYSDPIRTDTVSSKAYETITTGGVNDLGRVVELEYIQLFREGDRSTVLDTYYLLSGVRYTPTGTVGSSPQDLVLATAGMIAIDDDTDATLSPPTNANFCKGTVKGSLAVIFTVDGTTPESRNSLTAYPGQRVTLDNRPEILGFRARTQLGTSKQASFAPAAVDVANNQIVLENHGLPQNAIIRFDSTTLPAGLSSPRPYWVDVVDANHFRLWTEEIPKDRAGAATNQVNITSTGTGTHSFTCISIFCHSFEVNHG